MVLIFNGLWRLFGNFIKLLGFAYHFIFTKKRFNIPFFSPAKFKPKQSQQVSATLYQTNYSNQVTLPMYCNYLVNRLMSLNYDYVYVSTEQREEIIKKFATERYYQAYIQLTDGASQADFWRVFMLWQFGGVYLDIDGQLVVSLKYLIKSSDNELLIKRHGKFTNFFIATKPKHPLLAKQLEIIVNNIENKNIQGGVFVMTGPDTLNCASLEFENLNFKRDKLVAAQGTFTNEYFQYIDKPGSKWCYKENNSLLKSTSKDNLQ